jgi:hypothetical protein
MDTNIRRRKRATTFRRAGWLVVIALATMALFATPGVALGHSATVTCGGFLQLDWKPNTADITRTDVIPNQVIFANVAGDGKYAVVPGSYTVAWSDNVSHSYTVPACPTPKAHLTLLKNVINDGGGTALASAWTLSATGPDTLSGKSGISGDVSAGSYALAEGSGPANYVAGAGWVCQNDQTEGDNSPANLVTSISLSAGDSVTCTITNTYVPPTSTLKVIKALDYHYGGTLPVGSFNLHVKLNGNDVSGSPQAGSATGTTYTLGAGTYVVSEDTPPAGYSQEGISCVNNTVTPQAVVTIGSVTIGSGQAWVCTVTNTDIQPTLLVKKIVDNSNGGTLGSGDFQLYVKSGGTNVSGSPAAGSADGTRYHLSAGTYTVSEDAVTGYTLSGVAGSCRFLDQAISGPSVISVTLAVGDHKTCTLTNTSDPAHLTLKKIVSGGTATADQWTLTATLNQSTDSAATGITGPGPQVGPSDVKAGTYTLSESGSPANYSASAWSCTGGSLKGDQLTLANGESATCTITNRYTSPLQGWFYFTKTVTGDLAGWTGGTFPFTVTCGASVTSVSLAVGASGSTVQSFVFGPFSRTTTCSVVEGTMPAAGTGASWGSPSYVPTSGSTAVELGQLGTVAVTDTRSITPLKPTPNPTPTPTGSVEAATGTPNVTPPPTGTVGDPTGQPAGDTWLLLLALAGLAATILLLTPTSAARGRRR